MLSLLGKRLLGARSSRDIMLRRSSSVLRGGSRIAAKITRQSATSSPQSFSTASSSLSNDNTDNDEGNMCHDEEIQQANLDYANRLVVREISVDEDGDGGAMMGWGVYATTDYEAESLVLTGRTRRDPAATTTNSSSSSSSSSAHSIQTGWDEHVIMDLPARFLNHACGSGANVGVRLPATSSRNSSIRRDEGQTVGDSGMPVYDFVAKRDIAAGEQLFFDYETTEYQLQSPFDCACGSPDCRGRLKGFGEHNARVLQDHGSEWIAPYLLETLDRS